MYKNIQRYRERIDRQLHRLLKHLDTSGYQWPLASALPSSDRVNFLGISTSINRFSLSKYWPYNSTSLCPAPSTHKGSTVMGVRSYISSPWEKSITSSSVPCITITREVIFSTFSMLQNKHRMNLLHGIGWESIRTERPNEVASIPRLGLTNSTVGWCSAKIHIPCKWITAVGSLSVGASNSHSRH